MEHPSTDVVRDALQTCTLTAFAMGTVTYCLSLTLRIFALAVAYALPVSSQPCTFSAAVWAFAEWRSGVCVETVGCVVNATLALPCPGQSTRGA